MATNKSPRGLWKEKENSISFLDRIVLSLDKVLIPYYRKMGEKLVEAEYRQRDLTGWKADKLVELVKKFVDKMPEKGFSKRQLKKALKCSTILFAVMSSREGSKQNEAMALAVTLSSKLVGTPLVEKMCQSN